MTDNITRATFYEGRTSASILFDRLCSENEALHAALERIMCDHYAILQRQREAAEAAVAQLTRERDEARAALRPQSYRHREDQKWWGEQLRHTFACFADIQRRARLADYYRKLYFDGARAYARRFNERCGVWGVIKRALAKALGREAT